MMQYGFFCLFSLLVFVLAEAQQRQPATGTSTTTLHGSIVTRTDVQEFVNLTLDVKDIRLASTGQEALDVYLKGKNSWTAINDNYDVALFALRKLSEKLVLSRPWTPTFSFHLYGLADQSTDMTDLEEYALYGDSAIQHLAAADKLDVLPDAILALGLWMYAAHLLHEGVLQCSRRSKADDPNFVQLVGGGGFDEFIGLWIGADQSLASEDGDSLYAWTQKIGLKFGTNSPEAAVNSRLKLLYHEGITALSKGDACTKANTRTTQQLWNVASRMINEMVKPLFQYLIYSLRIGDQELVSIYAKALIPQISKCRPSVYKRLKAKLLDVTVNFRQENIDSIITDLEATYSCFGFDCSSIGALQSIRVAADAGRIEEEGTIEEEISAKQCEDSNMIAGYQPSTDVAPVSFSDRNLTKNWL